MGVEFADVVRARRMTRDFAEGPVPDAALRRIVAAARSAPSAGFAQGVDWLVLTGGKERAGFFDAVTDARFRAEPGAASLFRAGAVLLPVADPEAYVRRYAEPDKALSDLAGRKAHEWEVAYWTVDAAFGVMAALLAAEDEGLGALFFRLHGEPARLEGTFGIPGGRVLIGAVAVGLRPDGPRALTGSPVRRPRRPLGDQVHFDRW